MLDLLTPTATQLHIRRRYAIRHTIRRHRRVLKSWLRMTVRTVADSTAMNGIPSAGAMFRRCTATACWCWVWVFAQEVSR